MSAILVVPSVVSLFDELVFLSVYVVERLPVDDTIEFHLISSIKDPCFVCEEEKKHHNRLVWVVLFIFEGLGC